MNPFSGRKKAPGIYKSKVAPILAKSHVDHELLLTERAGHAAEVGRTVDLDKYDALVTISGDGLLNEVINGLMTHADWQKAVKKTVAVIPGGTSHAIAHSIGLYDPYHAVLNIIKFDVRPLDMFAVVQAGQPTRYGFLCFLWGLMSDVDIGSETIRWAGEARMTIAAVMRIMSPHRYRARLSYVQWHPDVHAPPEQARASSDGSRPDLPLTSSLDDRNLPDDWIVC